MTRGKENKMKYLKQKLMAAVAMLAVSTVMLTSASYAWFTISVTPEVKTVTTTVTSNENFEIALGTTGTTVDPDAYATTAANNVTAYNTTTDDHTWGATVTSLTELEGLGPATINDNVVQTTLYGEDGRPAGYVNVTEVGSMADGVQKLADAEGNIVGQKILFWLRSNVTGAVTADVTGITLETAIGTAASADNKVTVAFDWDADGQNVVVPAYAEGKKENISIATIATADVNRAIPVYVYVYLEGANVTNADVEDAFEVVIGSIKFYNEGVDASKAYEHDDLNVKNN